MRNTYTLHKSENIQHKISQFQNDLQYYKSSINRK